ncbi:MAG: hypothetical protein OSB12_10865, partial [Planctomycetota bacterium]|nr:hypothetical protein [Planctomycetota bacterium]
MKEHDNEAIWKGARMVGRSGIRWLNSAVLSMGDFCIGGFCAVRGKPGIPLDDPGARGDLRESAVVGGLLLVDATLETAAPEEMERVFAAAYPGLSVDESVDDAIARLEENPAALEGLLSGIKGKLFEQRAADALSGELSDGTRVELATSATQPGHDLEFISDSGEVYGVLQAKAVSSVDEIIEHYQRYPEIPVIATEEVRATLADHPALANWQPEIAVADLDQEMAQLVEGASSIEVIPLGTSAVLLWHLSTGEGDLEMRLCRAGDVIGRNVPAVLVAGAVGTLTGTLWCVIPAAIYARWLTGEGQKKRQSVW